MAKYNYRCCTLISIIAANGFSVASVIMIIVSMSWQGLVEYIPKYTVNPSDVSCIYQVPRREGFIYMCHTLSPDDLNINKPGIPCIPLDTQLNNEAISTSDVAYWEIADRRRSALIAVIIGVICGFAGIVLLAFFTRDWLRASDQRDFRRVDRLLIAILFHLAGLLCRVAIQSLHVNYVRDKYLRSSHLKLTYTSWDQDVESFSIDYSHSYYLLTTGAYFFEIAGVIILIAGHFIHMLFDSTRLDEGDLQGILGFNPTLQRYAVEEKPMNTLNTHEREFNPALQRYAVEEQPMNTLNSRATLSSVN